ncbi:MAG: transcription antitermination factor NusB [Planctomycetota bacterium]|nr:transcription antitermination factor NusB [Planctomycetota bacterium]
MTQPDPARIAGFDALLQLPGTADSAGLAIVEALSPVERDRAFNIAARRLAFQLLFEIDAGATPPDALEQRLARVEGLGPVLHERVLAMVRGSYDARAAADAEFVQLAPDWPTHRQPAVDRAILRLAHHELTLGQTPGAVVVNEAVELARHYSTEKSPSFVNALLDRVLKRLSGPAEAR